jgi:hypothetical protein
VVVDPQLVKKSFRNRRPTQSTFANRPHSAPPQHADKLMFASLEYNPETLLEPFRTITILKG